MSPAAATATDPVVTGATWRWRAALDDHVPRVAASPNGDRIAVASLSGQALVLDAADGSVRAELPSHALGTLDIAWSPDGTALATAGQDGRVRVLDAADGSVLGEHRGTGWAASVRWSNDGTRLAAAIGKEAVMLRRDGSVAGSFGTAAHTIADVVWTTDDRRLGVLSYGGVRWFGTGSPKPRPDRTFEWKGSPLRAAMSPTGAFLVHGNQDNSVHVWRMTTADEMEMSGYPAKVEVLGWDRTGDWLAVGTIGMTTVWDCSGKGPAGRRATACEGHDRRVSALAWSDSTPSVLVTGSADGTVQWYRPTTVRAGATLQPEAGVMVGGEVSDLALVPLHEGPSGAVAAIVALQDGTVGSVVLELGLDRAVADEKVTRGRGRAARRGAR